MWSTLLSPGLALMDGRNRALRRAGQELAHAVVHRGDGVVLWCDGDHGFNPYDHAELNLARGHAADHGSERILIKRCMTPFQWDTALADHMPAKLDELGAELVLVIPYDRLFSTDELKPWEQEDYIRYSLRSMREQAHQHDVPIVLGVDVHRWRMHHPQLAGLLEGAFDHRWTLRAGGVGRRVDAGVGHAGSVGRGRQTRLSEFVIEPP